jgi:hypothetical protein
VFVDFRFRFLDFRFRFLDFGAKTAIDQWVYECSGALISQKPVNCPPQRAWGLCYKELVSLFAFLLKVKQI